MGKPRLGKGDSVLVTEPGARWQRCTVLEPPQYNEHARQWVYIVGDGSATGRITDGDLAIGDARSANA